MRWTVMPKKLELINLGLVGYEEARAIQDKYVQERITNTRSDLVLFCEHPPTITYTKRTKLAHINYYLENGPRLGVNTIQVERGGEATYHGPGQLLIYPVIELRSYRLGIKSFIELILGVLSVTVCFLGIKAESKLNPAGVWVFKNGNQHKIAQVGLQIIRGVTNHGFALNVTCDIAPFANFVSCGLVDLAVTSVANEIGTSDDLFNQVSNRVQDCILQAFESKVD